MSAKVISQKPCFLKKTTQQATYLMKRQHYLVKATIVTTVALVVIALIILPILNQYGVINAFSSALQWSVLSMGLATSLIALTILYRFRKSKIYQINKNTAQRINLEEGMQFLSKNPKWHSVKTCSRSGSYLRKSTRYHEWYEFVDAYDERAPYGAAQKMGDPTLQAHLTSSHMQVYYCPHATKKEPLKGEKIELCQTNMHSPHRKYYPFFDDKNNIYIASSGFIKRVTFKHNKNIAPIKPNEFVSTIRYEEGILIVGYRSGLVQLFDISNVEDNEVGREISHLRADGKEVLDAWIDKESQKLIIVSNGPPTCWLGLRRRRIEAWQF